MNDKYYEVLICVNPTKPAKRVYLSRTKTQELVLKAEQDGFATWQAGYTVFVNQFTPFLIKDSPCVRLTNADS